MQRLKLMNMIPLSSSICLTSGQKILALGTLPIDLHYASSILMEKTQQLKLDILSA